MAMTKKEREALVDLQRQLEEARAFRFTDDVAPDVMPPKEGYAIGFFAHHLSSFSPVSKGWTSSVYHGSSEVPGKHASQGSRYLYSTELLAYRAVRRAMEKEFSEKLARIDRKIAELVAGPETA